MFYISRLTPIFGLLFLTENWASREVSCGQTERTGQGWLLQPLPNLQLSHVTLGVGPVYHSLALAMRGGGSCRRHLCMGCSFIHTIFRQKRDFWTSSGWITITSAAAMSWITPLFFFKVSAGASGTATFSSNSRDLW